MGECCAAQKRYDSVTKLLHPANRGRCNWLWHVSEGAEAVQPKKGFFMSNWKLHSGVAAAIMATAAIVAPAEAQVTTAGIRGNVVDSEGAPIANADVIVRDEATGLTRTTTTTSAGQFVIRSQLQLAF